jgi:hypothetical protein
MNPKPGFGTPDLRLTGEFYSEFTLPQQTDFFQFGSNDPKTRFLVDRYGRNIFGLSDKSKNQYINDIFYQKFMAAVKRQL